MTLAQRPIDVLAVDDDPTTRAVISVLMRKHGVAAATCAHGGEMWAALERHRPRVIVLDVGISDDVCKDASYEYADRLTANGFQPVFYDREGGHEGIIWQSGFYQFARRIFA